MRSFFCYCYAYTSFSAKLVLKRAVERRIVFKSHHIDELSALRSISQCDWDFLKKNWEMGFGFV
jgi:hypothetical protein